MLILLGHLINFFAVCSLPNSDDATEDTPTEKYFRQIIMPLALTPGTKALFGIMAVIGIIVSTLLLRGNFKSNARIMKPAVYWWLACLVFNTIITIVGICQVASVDSSSVAPLVIELLLYWVVSLLLIQVIRCRIADVEEVEIH